MYFGYSMPNYLRAMMLFPHNLLVKTPEGLGLFSLRKADATYSKKRQAESHRGCCLVEICTIFLKQLGI